jgi:hypothetical protein
LCLFTDSMIVHMDRQKDSWDCESRKVKDEPKMTKVTKANCTLCVHNSSWNLKVLFPNRIKSDNLRCESNRT